ncbi:MAG UNVERIFIED_CONTAM: hypothetical protein LVR29_26320 [Microcystis novacekii LVE1205-3]
MDSKTASGWSLKSLQMNSLTTDNTFLFVIQRADIIKKAIQLGVPSLNLQSSPHNWEPLLFNTGTRRFAPVKLLKMSSTAMREYC